MKLYALSLAIGLLIAQNAIAGDAAPQTPTCTQVCGSPDCCHHCGAQGECQRSCKIVCEMKEVKKTVWVVKCGEFCTMMPNLGCKCKCGECNECVRSGVCADRKCGKCDPCSSLTNRNYLTPDCGRVRGKKTLEKKEITCKVPTYKCVVEYTCAACGTTACSEGAKPAETKAPAENSAPTPAPAPQARTPEGTPLPPVVSTSYTRR
jgi:hypothetical protein